MRKPVASYVLLLSLAANLLLGALLYGRDHALNQVTWGYAVTELWQDINWGSLSITDRKDGRVMGSGADGVRQALEDLDGMQYLPFWGRRANFEDVQTLRQFLHYAERAHALALKEQGDSGTVSALSVARLQKIHEGLEQVLRGQVRTNELTNARNPWNHAAWRQLWRQTAENLRKLDFIPLPE